MEFSKKWMIGSALISLALIIACAAGRRRGSDGGQ